MKLQTICVPIIHRATTPLLSGLLLPTLAGAAELRALSTDRPDTTESAYTVDAGHYQFELEIANIEHDGGNKTYNFGEMNAKIGLNSSTDFQLVLPIFSHQETDGEGFGDIVLRLKHNLWGNDSGTTACAVMPFLKLPSANGDLGNGEIEGGLIIPLSFQGPADWSCAVMTEVGVSLDEDGSGYHPVFLNSATASHGLTETTGIFLELVSSLSTDEGADSEAYFNTGCTWAITETMQLDGGVRLGLNSASADFTPFLGFSVKY